jgi:hypothetical protein
MDNRKELMADIYPAQNRPVARLSRAPQPLPPEPPRRRKRIIAIFIGVPLLAAVLFYGTRGIVVKNIATDSVALIQERVNQAKQALVALDITTAQSAFIEIKLLAEDIQNEASRYGLLTLAEVFGTVSPKIAAAPEALSLINRLSDKVLSLIQISELLKKSAFDFMVNNQGKTLIGYLSKLKEEVSDLGHILEEMKRSAASLDYPVGDDVLAFRAELYQSEQLLDAAIEWLSDTNHVAITFINPSEIRPGGGFPGSYAGVTLSKGNLGSIEVKDIYDPDGQLSLKVIPPKQLQLITQTWGARDANWFFDFPTSARKTLYFLNSSKIYSEQDLTFSALLAINVRVISDILSVIGPIELPEYDLTLTGKNFLDEVQREVRSGNDRLTGEPKRILRVLTPVLFERLGALSAEGKKQLITILRERFASKDMLAYIDDTVMQSYLEQLGIAGEVSQAEDGSLNEYLAVVNANIGGGKTDAVISQSITLKSRVDLEGKINNALTVRRTHKGKASSDAWYNVVNKNFLQIFTPRGSSATSARGADTAPTIAKPDTTGYRTDSDVTAIEGSLESLSGLNLQKTLAFNKTVFSGWVSAAPGTTKTFEMQYVNPQKLSPGALADYVFIFEKQSGVDTELSFSIDAPPEYKWKENNSATYTYSSPSAPGKLELRLTLIPIR